MATKYQCEKAIKQLVETNADNPNVQGYGIGRATDYGMDKDVGFVIVVYTATAPSEITKIEKLEEPKPKQKMKKKSVKKAAKKSAKSKPKPVASPAQSKAMKNLPEPIYPDKTETTSRKKKVQVPLEYVETGAFGFD